MNKKAVCDAVVNQMLNDKDEALRNLDGFAGGIECRVQKHCG